MVRIGRTESTENFTSNGYKYSVGFQREKHGKTWKTRAIVFEKSPYSKSFRFVGDYYGKTKKDVLAKVKKIYKKGK